MTRNFNNSRRDGAHSSARNYSASRPGDRRFSRPPRPTGPRPHRASMDQAWEEGAAPKHADYRARTPQRPSSQRNSRNYQSSEHSPAHNGPRPFGNRQNNSQRFERAPRSNNGNYAPRSRSFGPDRRTFDDRRDDGRRDYASGPNRRDSHADFRDNRDREQRSEYRERTYERGPSQGGPRRFDRQPREFERNERFPRNRKDNRQPDTSNPRWQSRPPAQRNNEFRRSPDFVKRPHTHEGEEAQFEGDYERFHDGDAQPEERHVTRLPDGRVLKGPRPQQRREARFWTDVADETDALIQPTKSRQANRSKPAQASSKAGSDKTARKPRTHKASAVVREKKSKGRQAHPKGGSTVPKPSQRGFKWPPHKQA